MNAFQGGQTREGLAAALVSSPEYLSLTNTSNPANWVASIYGDLLQRSPSADEVTYWTGILRRGASRLTVAQLITLSSEYSQLQETAWVQTTFQSLLKFPLARPKGITGSTSY